MKDQTGSVMVEATLGIVFILYVALAVAQLSLVFHATLAAQSAAVRTARAVSLAPGHDPQAGNQVYQAQQGATLGSLRWDVGPVCQISNNQVACAVTVRVPTFLPAGGLFFGNGLKGPIEVTQQGYFPIFR